MGSPPPTADLSQTPPGMGMGSPPPTATPPQAECPRSPAGAKTKTKTLLLAILLATEGPFSSCGSPLDEEPSDRAVQLENTWNELDCSRNIYVRHDDPLTLHRNRVYQTTDGIRGKMGYTTGLHIWEVRWPECSRGSHPVVGISEKCAPLSEPGYKRLIGSNDTSWGWCLKTKKIYHDSRKFRNGISYPKDLDKKIKIPSSFLMLLDMDLGTLSFQVDDDFLGVAFSGLRGLKLYPVVSAVWGNCEVSLKYIGTLKEDKDPLKEKMNTIYNYYNVLKVVHRENLAESRSDEADKKLVGDPDLSVVSDTLSEASSTAKETTTDEYTSGTEGDVAVKTAEVMDSGEKLPDLVTVDEPVIEDPEENMDTTDHNIWKVDNKDEAISNSIKVADPDDSEVKKKGIGTSDIDINYELEDLLNRNETKLKKKLASIVQLATKTLKDLKVAKTSTTVTVKCENKSDIEDDQPSGISRSVDTPSGKRMRLDEDEADPNETNGCRHEARPPTPCWLKPPTKKQKPGKQKVEETNKGRTEMKRY